MTAQSSNQKAASSSSKSCKTTSVNCSKSSSKSSNSNNNNNNQATNSSSSAMDRVNAFAASKSALLSSKTRNLSFPKFRPNAKELMQSIKNTSAQIVNKHAGFSAKSLCTLSAHKEAISDIAAIPIPTHLLLQSNSSGSQQFVSGGGFDSNLLIGTASADSTARLWYFNKLKRNGQY